MVTARVICPATRRRGLAVRPRSRYVPNERCARGSARPPRNRRARCGSAATSGAGAAGPSSRQTHRMSLARSSSGGVNSLYCSASDMGCSRFYKTLPRRCATLARSPRTNIRLLAPLRTTVTIPIHRLALVTALLASPLAAQTVPRPPSPKEGTSAVQQLSWFAGCWRRQAPGGSSVVEEHWMAPRAGMALGTSRTVRGDTMVHGVRATRACFSAPGTRSTMRSRRARRRRTSRPRQHERHARPVRERRPRLSAADHLSKAGSGFADRANRGHHERPSPRDRLCLRPRAMSVSSDDSYFNPAIAANGSPPAGLGGAGEKSGHVGDGERHAGQIALAGTFGIGRG